MLPGILVVRTHNKRPFSTSRRVTCGRYANWEAHLIAFEFSTTHRVRMCKFLNIFMHVSALEMCCLVVADMHITSPLTGLLLWNERGRLHAKRRFLVIAPLNYAHGHAYASAFNRLARFMCTPPCLHTRKQFFEKWMTTTTTSHIFLCTDSTKCRQYYAYVCRVC